MAEITSPLTTAQAAERVTEMQDRLSVLRARVWARNGSPALAEAFDKAQNRLDALFLALAYPVEAPAR